MWYPTSLCCCLKRYKNKLIFSGVLAGGVYTTFKLAQYKVRKVMEYEQEMSLKNKKHQMNLEQVKLHCSSLIEAMLEPVKIKVIQVANTETITEQLKSGNSDKLLLWNELKISVFQRILTSIYSIVIMTIVLHIQLFQIAGILHRNLLNTEDNFDPKQQQFLSTCHSYLLESGIEKLSKKIQESVFNITNTFPLQCMVTCYDLESTISSISSTILYQADEDSLFNISDFVLAKTESLGDNNEWIIKLMDILDSPDCQKVFVDCIENSVSMVGKELFVLMENNKPVSKVHEVDSLNIDIDANKIALAKSLPILNQQVHKIFSTNFLDQLNSSPILETFSINVYKSFLQE